MGAKKKKIIASIGYLMKYSKSEPLASLGQSLGPLHDDLACDEDPYLHSLEPTRDCLELAQHSWVLYPSYIKAQHGLLRDHTRFGCRTVSLHHGYQSPCRPNQPPLYP